MINMVGEHRGVGIAWSAQKVPFGLHSKDETRLPRGHGGRRATQAEETASAETWKLDRLS